MMCEITWDLQSEGQTFRQEMAEFGIGHMLGRSSLETVLLTAEGAEAGETASVSNQIIWRESEQVLLHVQTQ